jgi:hypothetical protein
MLVNHIVTIGWYSLNDIEAYYDIDNWLVSQDIADQIWWVKYVICYYWGLSLLTTGGATSPSISVYEYIYAIVAILGTVCMIGYIISMVMSIMQAINEKNQRKKHEVTIMNTYMEQKDIRGEV